ncbi:MAG: TIGR04076 family protein [Chloroflexi bacterium]|nr:TIGR04076 family protein [Chloroflexota bacterium]
MTQQRARQLGHRVVGTVTEVKGDCSWGHKVGDKFELSGHNTANLCGFFYHDIFPYLTMLQFGGGWPWGDRDVVDVECFDRHNSVKMQLKRVPD